MNAWHPLIPLASSLLVLTLVTACSGDGHSSSDNTPPPPEHKLRKVGNANELEAYLKAGLKTAVDANGSIATLDLAVPQPSPPTDAGSGEYPGENASFSNTTLIEAGVDEADVMKSDGSLVFIAVPGHYNCSELCILPTAETDSGTGIAVGEQHPSSIQNTIRVMQADDTTHSASEIARIAIPHSGEHDYQSLSGLMLVDENNEKAVVAISNASSNIYHESEPLFPDQWSSIWSWSYGSTIVDTFDVDDTSAISQKSRIEIDGYLLQSRRVDDKLYIVTRFTPEVVITGTPETQNATIDALSLTQLLPEISVNGDKSTLVSPDNCYVDTDVTGYPTLMVVTAIDLVDNSFQSSCVTANMFSFYMSKNALYLTQAQWSTDGNESTHIYKFALSEAGPAYRGEGRADGAPTANYNFSISEHDDVLRLVTTRRGETFTPFNQLHTFVEASDGDLQKLATLPNAQHPESIGKPGESVQGVRFVGARAYVVTFLRTDPLYVIDLSNPADPFVAGQVEIPGFSTLLQPLGNELLLGVGTETSNELKVELYDVQNPSAPQSIGKYVMPDPVGNGYSSSAAAWDHHALSLLQLGDVVRIAMPFYRYSYSSAGGYEEQQGALSFSVDLLNRNLTNVAESAVSSDELIYGEPRILLQQNSLHYVLGANIWSGLWGSNDPMTSKQ